MFSRFVLTLRFVLVCTLSLVATATLAQTTIQVGPGQTYTTIQSGIDAAKNGDTVLVAPGTYNENIDFKGKAITVTSSGGAASTIIDGGSAGPAITFKSGETSASTISGFTIQHGGEFGWVPAIGEYGIGNIYIVNSAPTILNNIITLGNCWGIESSGSAPLIQNNTISATQDPDGNCSFGGGAAIIIWGGMNGYNQAAVNAGRILGNIIENNVESGLEDAGGNGGAGIAVWGGAPLIEDNIIRNNASPGGSGGALHFIYSQGTVIAQNLIYGNSAGCGGGAIATDGQGLYVINNTIVDNVDVNTGGDSECASIAQIYPNPDLYGQDSPSDVFINNIISGSTSYPAVDCSWYTAPSEANQPTFQNNILYNAGGPFFGSHCVDVSDKYNNIAADPQFVSPSTHDYHLKSTSPAIDSGQNNVQQIFKTMTGLDFTQDFDGNPRVQDATGKGCIIDMGAYEYPGASSECGTMETLTSSLNPATVGQSVTFTAQLTTQSGVPTGSIQFLDGTTPLATQTVSSTGSSSFSTSSLAVGSHNITASYEPTGSSSASTASLTQVINGYATTTALSCLPNPIDIDKSSVFTATVTSANGTPAGSVTFTDNGAALATQGLLSGTTSFTYTGSIAGTHTITATYTPSGPFAASSATCSEVVNALPTTSVLTATPAISTYGSPVTLTATVSPATLPGPSTPSGVVTFYNGASVIGTVTLAGGVANLSTGSLPGGSYDLTCMYSGSSVYATSNCNPVPVIIRAVPTSISLTGMPNPGYLGQPVTMVATVSSQTASIPAGTVTFYDSSTSLGSAQVTANNTASVAASFSVAGVHDITAMYAGDASFSGSSSAVFKETILAGDFSIAVLPGAVSVYTGESAAVKVGVTSLQSFHQPLALTCLGLPANTTCSFSPASLTDGQGQAKLVIQTTAPHQVGAGSASGSVSGSAMLGALTLLLLPGWKRRRGFLALFFVVLLTAGVGMGMAGCGSPGPITGGTPPGVYQIAVTATTTGSGAPLSHSAIVTLTVKSFF